MNRFFVEKNNIKESTIIITDPEDIKHISKVLRLQVDEWLEISDGEKYEYVGRIMNISNKAVEVAIVNKSMFLREPVTKVTLYQGIPKQSKMDYIVQKSVELGVSEIVPVFTKRTVVQDKGNFHKKIDRWQRIALGASKQCRRGIVPIVKETRTYEEVLQAFQEQQLILLLNESENEIKIKDILRKEENSKKSIAIIIGSEGGFSEDEVNRAIKAGAVSVSLGKTILRTETAGAVALAVIFYELEG